MQRWGFTRAGKPRFHCAACGLSATRQRPDNAARADRDAFANWLLQGLSQRLVANHYGITPRALRDRFRFCWGVAPLPLLATAPVRGIILDGTSVQKHCRVVLVVQDAARRRPVSWHFVPRESYPGWQRLLQGRHDTGLAPDFAVCDGQKGLLKALRATWPTLRIQRCLVHVVRQAKLLLTQHPQTAAGQALLCLVRQLLQVRTKRQRRRWRRAYRRWLRRHAGFMKQRTHHPTTPRRWWYTHRKLRAVRSLLNNSLPDLFHYVRHPEIPRTTNHVEGGINSRLKDLYRRHRGLSLDRKTLLTAWYLASRQTSKKPTRNFL